MRSFIIVVAAALLACHIDCAPSREDVTAKSKLNSDCSYYKGAHALLCLGVTGKVVNAYAKVVYFQARLKCTDEDVQQFLRRLVRVNPLTEAIDSTGRKCPIPKRGALDEVRPHDIEKANEQEEEMPQLKAKQDSGGEGLPASAIYAIVCACVFAACLCFGAAVACVCRLHRRPMPAALPHALPAGFGVGVALVDALVDFV